MTFPASPTFGQIHSEGTGLPSFVYRDAGGGTGVWQNVGMGYGYSPVAFTATPGQTTINVAYQVGAVDVYVEGARLLPEEFTATNGTSIVMAVPFLGGEKGVVIPLSVLSTLQGLAKSANLSDLASVPAARAVLGQWGAVIFDETLAVNATQFTDIPLAGYQDFRFNLRLHPNAGAADFATVGLFSYDGGGTFPSGASEFTRLAISGSNGAVASSTVTATSILLCGTVDTATTGIVGRSEGSFWKGSATERPRFTACCSYYDGAFFNVSTFETLRQTVGLATHLRVSSNVANGLGPGSRLTIEARP